MFGGIGFLLNGNMCCGIHKNDLIVRVEPERTDEELRRPHTRVFDLTGRPMKGWILVEPAALKTDTSLEAWVSLAVKYVSSLPVK
jgi:TfoX/Sxy family transcriptional regulator of competence genes